MSPWWCSHSGLRRWLTSSIPGATSTSVRSKWAFMCDALLPPPLPSSSTVRSGDAPDAMSMSRYTPASSAYSSGADMSGHHSASSWYSLGGFMAGNRFVIYVCRTSGIPRTNWRLHAAHVDHSTRVNSDDPERRGDPREVPKQRGGANAGASARTAADGRPASGVESRASGLREELEGERRRSEEHTSELQSPCNLVCRLLLEK